MMEQVLDIPQQEVITKDNATVTVDGIAFFQVLDAAKASYEVADLEQAHHQAHHDQHPLGDGRAWTSTSCCRSATRSTSGCCAWSTRRSSPWGVKVTRIEIKDIVPPADLVAVDGPADEGRAREARRRSSRPKASASRRSCKAEGEKQAQILEAEGRREAAFRDAEARERSAEAEAKATEMVSEAIASGDVAALNYFVAQKYTQGARRSSPQSPNQKVLMLPIEATGVLGSLAGIAEIAKATFGGDGSGGDGRRRRRGGRPCRRRRADDLTEARHDARCHRSSRSAPGPGSSSAPILLALELAGARRVHDVARARRASWSASISLAIDWSWQAQLIAFAVFAVASIPLWRRFARKVEQPAEQPFLNRRADALCRARVHARQADRRRHRHDPDRRHRLARDRARPARRAAGCRVARRRRRGAGGGASERDGLGDAERAADRACARCRPACRPRRRTAR